jgi:hypothetical protein
MKSHSLVWISASSGVFQSLQTRLIGHLAFEIVRGQSHLVTYPLLRGVVSQAAVPSHR